MLGDHTTTIKAYQTPYNNYCKYALGLHKSASTSGVLTELRRTQSQAELKMNGLPHFN